MDFETKRSVRIMKSSDASPLFVFSELPFDASEMLHREMKYAKDNVIISSLCVITQHMTPERM